MWWFVLLWIACGVLSAGFTFAYLQGLFPRHAAEGWREDLGQSLLFGLLLGPVMLVLSVFLSGFCRYGWRLWPKERAPQ